MFLLDTNVVSAARKKDPAVAEWLSAQGRESLYLSVLTLGEVSRGVKMKARKDVVAARHLETWLTELRRAYENRILDVSEHICLEWGRIAAIRTRGPFDSLIAATAIVHNLTVATRNIPDFADTGAMVINPWAR
jgi:predicted nucleic acid-binding protein